ncbi:MAG TPA: hypothetical protein VML54_06870, partial [Candidatus Limnocylindrales bacterium]|nr:hypothetical protein [Candidatus Limnocylindrales bacterium]
MGLFQQPARLVRVALAAGVVALTALPIIVTAVIVATTGAENISNDYIAYVGLVDRVLAGTYDWRHYFRDTFLGGSHSMALPVLVRLAVVTLSAWSVYTELWIVLALSLARLVLLRAALARLVPGRSAWVLWPVLAALVFSPSQINVFTYGDAGLQIALNQAALALSIWGLVAFPGRWRGVCVMMLGGIAGALSGGAGLLAWPV